MALQCGILGLPNVGKSTLFNALSKGKAEAANYPFCTIEPNVGVITVPDERLTDLEKLVKPEKVVPTIMEFVDIAGLVKGASRGEGLGNKFLGNIREVDALIHVVRCFHDNNIVHVAGKINPVEDKEVIDTELQVKDLESVEKKIAKTEKTAKTGDAKAKTELSFLLSVKKHLEMGKNIRTLDISPAEKETIADLQLLTLKPIIYVANVDENSINKGNELVEKLRESIQDETSELIVLCAAIEAQIAELEEDEKEMFLSGYNLAEPILNVLIKSSYHLLNLITYFTAGPKEVRAWTIQKGWKAPKAAGVIHTDFERGFIRAEVIPFAEFVKYGSEHACREAGKLNVEGKEYIVKDGDIMHFRFHV